MKPVEVLWGKSAKDGSKKWLPVWLHLRDTYQISGWLWDNIIPPSHKIIFMEDHSLSDTEAKTLLMVAAGLHDIGKASPDFSGRDRVVETTAHLKDRIEETSFSYREFNSKNDAIRHETASSIYLESILGVKGSSGRCFLAVVGGHHGFLNRPSKMDKTYFENIGPEWTTSASSLIDFILDLNHENRKILDKITLSGLSSRTQFLLTGWVICADWLASSEDNFPLIPFNEIPEMGSEYACDRFNNALERANDGRTLDIPVPFMPELIPVEENLDSLFAQRFNIQDAELRPMQRDLLGLVSDEKTNPRDIFIVEAPMGDGKTEAALLAGEILMRRSGTPGMYFGLPTMATSEAIYGRFVPYLQNLLLASRQQAPHNLVHSKKSLSAAFTENKGVAGTYQKGIVPAGWYESKNRENLIPFAVGTVDSFLMMVLKMKYFYWRHLGFSQKVIIIDEVHSLDAHMEEFLLQGLKYAGYYGCPVILLSATLKSSRKDKFITAYNEGKECLTTPILP